jgi:predicted DNA-binding protein (MmcQ/YjbR family)
MDLETFRNYCLSLPGVTEGFPFGDTVIVFKVGEKIFALADAELFASVNLKCDPELAIELRPRNQVSASPARPFDNRRRVTGASLRYSL